MLKKLGLLFRTVKYLRFTQIYHQIYYRVRTVKSLDHYLTEDSENIRFNPLNFSLRPFYLDLVNKRTTFRFLNREKSFIEQIDWNFMGFGKLWNYNLQYFNYLNQPDLEASIKDNLLGDITLNLRTGTLKLEPYPVSLRVMNTIRYYSGSAAPQYEIVKGLYGQLCYLNKNLEYHLLGNHLLENGFALIMGGAAFQKKTWVKKAELVLHNELNEQILEDGGHFELSPMYHQIILFRVLELIEWYKEYEERDINFLNFLATKAEQMLGWLKVVTFKDGSIPHLNDSAPDVAFNSSQLFNFAELLNLKLTSTQLRRSGYRKYEANGYECFIDVAELGPSYQSGHGHADCLSFILYGLGRPFIVDVGTSTYNIGKRRDYERSTSAHNTVLIAEKSQSEVWGGFRVGKRASARIIGESGNHLSAEHNGYENLGVVHRRTFNFFDNSIEVIDQIGHSKGQLTLHFHPDIKAVLTENGKVLIENYAVIEFNNDEPPILTTYQYAEGFNVLKDASKLQVRFKNEINMLIKFL